MAGLVLGFHEIFGDKAREFAPEELVAQLLQPTHAPNIDSVVYQWVFGQNGKLFQPEIGGFGRPVRTKQGELLYVRARSFIGTIAVSPCLTEHLTVNESRELTFVVTSANAARRSGRVSQLIAYLRPLTFNGPSDHEKASACPSTASYGMNVAPLLLVDHHTHKPKKSAPSINSCPAILCGSQSIADRWDSKREALGNTSSVMRGIESLTLSEWVAGRPRIERRLYPPIVQHDVAQHEAALHRSNERIQRQLKEGIEARAHGVDSNDDRPEEILTDNRSVWNSAYAFLSEPFHFLKIPLPFLESARSPTHTSAHTHTLPNLTHCGILRKWNRFDVNRYSFLDHATMVSFLDLVASDAHRGMHVGSLEDPFQLPLYIAACVVIAAAPHLARLPTGSSSRVEDGSYARSLMRSFHSLTGGVHHATGIRSTALESLIELVTDDVALFGVSDLSMNVLCSRVGNGVVIENVEYVLRGMEAMRRAGAAVLQELFADPPTAISAAAERNVKEWLGAAAVEAARDVVDNPIASAALKPASVGSWLPELQRRLRRSTRAALQHSLLKTLLDVNEFLESGVFRMNRAARANDVVDESRNGKSTGLPRNVHAFELARETLSIYFKSGPRSLALNGLPLVIPLRPRTRVKCGLCAKNFDFRETLTRLSTARCSVCDAHFCSACAAPMDATVADHGCRFCQK